MGVPSTVESLIADASLSAHLATSVDERPHVAPVWYGYRDGVIYVMTGGRKLANVRRNPRVALSIEDATNGRVNWHVALLGTATVSDDPERMAWAREWIFGAYGDDSDDVGSDGHTDGQDENHTDGGTETETETESGGDGGEGDVEGYALVEVAIGSVSWNVY